MKNLFSLDVQKISDVKVNERISFYAKIENLNVQQTVNQTDFFNLVLVDETGIINAKKWDISDEEKSF